MPLPKALRRLTPDSLRDDPRLRAVAVGAGLIPPRTMHSDGESALLERLAAGRRRVVEVGVYEGASAIRFVRVLGGDAELHLIDPFGEHPTALRPGARATAGATKRVVARAAAARGAGGPEVIWHVERSEDTARGWSAPVDLVFIDGDHSEAGCRLDWELWSPHVQEGGVVVFHDAREGVPGGRGLAGPTAVVDALFRGADGPPAGWRIAEEVDSAVAVERAAATA